MGTIQSPRNLYAETIANLGPDIKNTGGAQSKLKCTQKFDLAYEGQLLSWAPVRSERRVAGVFLIRSTYQEQSSRPDRSVLAVILQGENFNFKSPLPAMGLTLVTSLEFKCFTSTAVFLLRGAYWIFVKDYRDLVDSQSGALKFGKLCESIGYRTGSNYLSIHVRHDETACSSS